MSEQIVNLALDELKATDAASASLQMALQEIYSRFKSLEKILDTWPGHVEDRANRLLGVGTVLAVSVRHELLAQAMTRVNSASGALEKFRGRLAALMSVEAAR